VNSRKDFQEREYFDLGSGGMLLQGAAARATVGLRGMLMLDSGGLYQNVLSNKPVNLDVSVTSTSKEGRKRELHGFGQSEVSIVGYVQEDNLAVDLAE